MHDTLLNQLETEPFSNLESLKKRKVDIDSEIFTAGGGEVEVPAANRNKTDDFDLPDGPLLPDKDSLSKLYKKYKVKIED